MRVIAGEARGLHLSAPSPAIRPTMDRVREAIFSSLGEVVAGARVLDLFAGSGALGIEALSRGALSALFVDVNPRCAACVRENLRRAKLDGSVQVMDALKFVELYAEPGDYDLVFADPPYGKSAVDRDFGILLTIYFVCRRSLSLWVKKACSSSNGSPALPNLKQAPFHLSVSAVMAKLRSRITSRLNDCGSLPV